VEEGDERLSIGGGNCKGTAVDWVRALVDKTDHNGDAAMARALSREDYHVYRSIMGVSWIAQDVVVRILAAAGDILFAHCPDVPFEMGRAMAKTHMTSVYRILLKVATIPIIVSQAARVWRTLNDRGDASCISEPECRRATFIVNGFPEYSAFMRRVICGYIVGLGALAGEDVTTRLDDSDPNTLKWISTWR
jgi:hypothetical protein